MLSEARLPACSLVLWLGILLCPARGHELDDGFVERAVQIVVRDRQATITYSFGLTAVTLDQWMDGGVQRLFTESPVAAVWLPRAFAASSADALQPGTETAAITFDRPPPSSLTLAPEFAERLLEKMAGSLQVSVNGRPLDVQTDSLQPSPRHHYRYIARFKFELPDSETTKLSVLDDNFRQFDGAARYALKARGATMVQQSNVMPIIVRAERHLLGKVALEKHRQICKIEAVLATMRSMSNGRP